MLYDILSPLIFFFSLGGILLIIGRVVIRLRRQQFTTAIRSTAGTASVLTSPLGDHTSAATNEILKPNQKSVHAMRSRLALMGHMFSSTKTSVSQGWQGWQTRRAEKSAAKAVETTETEAEPTTAETVTPSVSPDMAFLENEGVGITAPAKRSLLKRLAPWRKALATSAENPDASSVEPVESTPVASEQAPPQAVKTDATFRLVKKEEPAPADEAKPSVTPTPPVETTMGERGFAKALLRRARTKKTPVTALQQAEAALGTDHFQQAEDVLVPYIVEHPKDTWAYVLLGRAALGREAWVEAMEIFEQVVKWNNEQEGAYTGLGLAAYRAGKFTRALQALQRAHDADPEDITVLECLLSIAEKMDNRALQHSIHEKLDVLKTEEHAETSPVASEKISAQS